MSDSRTWLVSVLFLDIVGYSKVPVDQQLTIKLHFTDAVSRSLDSLNKQDCIQLDTGDGCAICYLGDPEKLFPIAIHLQGIFAGQQFMQADMNFSIMFPDGWQTINTPRFVGAFEPSQKALVLFGSPERPGPADQLAEAFADELRSKAKLEPTEMRAFKIGEWPAFLVRIEDTSGTEPVSIYNVWIN